MLYNMATIEQYTNRPALVQSKFASEQEYYKHQAFEDKLAILVCQIKIWQAKGHDWFNIPSVDQCLTIRECESIEIANSSKELINKAVVKFPRGTVIHQSSKKNEEVKTGTVEDSTENTSTLGEATNNGEVITTQTAQYSESGTSTTSMAVNYDDKGLIEFNRTKDDIALLSPNDVAIGNRIEIRLGYAYSEKEFNEMNRADSDERLEVAFTGFITSISVNTPLELECTNMAHILACVSAPNVDMKSSMLVSDFLESEKYHPLENTGIELIESSKNCTISVLGGEITKNQTVADVLTAWGKGGIRCMMETDSKGVSKLKVGYTYYAGKNGTEMPNKDKKYLTYRDNDSITLIQFDWDVVNDKLGLKNVDKKYLAVEAQGYTDKKFFKVTVRKNPDTDGDEWNVLNGDFQVVNKKEKSLKKNKKHKGGTKSKKKNTEFRERVPLDKYNVVTYFSVSKDLTEEKLIEEAKQYWNNYSPNGISGTLEIFGDLPIKPTDIVGLMDMRNPEKNGYYFVESVNTTFGIRGYHKELKIPFKIAPLKIKVI